MDQEFEEPLKKHSTQCGNRRELPMVAINSEVNDENSSDIKQTLESLSSPCGSHKLQTTMDISEESNPTLPSYVDDVAYTSADGGFDGAFDGASNNARDHLESHPNFVDSKDFDRSNWIDSSDLDRPTRKSRDCFEHVLPKVPRHSPVRESEGVEVTAVEFQGNNWWSRPPVEAEERNFNASTDLVLGRMAVSDVKQTTPVDGDEEAVRTLLFKYSSPSVLEKPTYEEMICLMKNSFSYLLPILSRVSYSFMLITSWISWICRFTSASKLITDHRKFFFGGNVEADDAAVREECSLHSGIF